MKDRLVSVDVLRGLTVAAMIIVNNPGSWEYIYPPLAHSEWHGCTPTDMVFPFFLFIVGASIHFSLSKSKSLSTQYRPIVIKILKRGVILFGLGLVLNAFPFIEFNHLRVMGVLQRISIVFVVTATLYLYLTRFQLYWVTVILLVFYWLFMCFVPIPGI
ncbi:MAG: heparan-alpha-glucosaminide N-acetyltransferase domain-containing protein, partial [Cytophagales bacterium]|nr:heparan-alpha-glucosaminide N-acetyltransferase domain-containing protein [Cytophagales bacterium]